MVTLLWKHMKRWKLRRTSWATDGWSEEAWTSVSTKRSETAVQRFSFTTEILKGALAESMKKKWKQSQKNS